MHQRQHPPTRPSRSSSFQRSSQIPLPRPPLLVDLGERVLEQSVVPHVTDVDSEGGAIVFVGGRGRRGSNSGEVGLERGGEVVGVAVEVEVGSEGCTEERGIRNSRKKKGVSEGEKVGSERRNDATKRERQGRAEAHEPEVEVFAEIDLLEGAQLPGRRESER